MSIKTFGELIDVVRQLHENLALCLVQGASQHKEERARMLLNYLAAHEVEIQRVISEFERSSSTQALNTYVPYLYAALEQAPSQPHKDDHASYASLSIDDISGEIFDFHDQVIEFYRHLSNEAQIPEAKELIESLLEFEHHEAMCMARQFGSINDI